MQEELAHTPIPPMRMLPAARPGVSKLAASSDGSRRNAETINARKLVGPLSLARNDESANSTFLSKASTPKVDTQSPAETASPSQDWEIKTLLGHGVQGMVWHAIMKQDGRHVAIKCLHRHHLSDINSAESAKQKIAKLFWTAFRNEIGILEACSGHPNIVQILGKAADYSQMLLEKADMDLKSRLRASGNSLSLDQCHRWSKDLLFGVGHLHALGVTHTDLKPENMLIGNENQIKICDFGTCQKGLAPGTQWTVISELSTLWYRAPELLLGSKTFDYKIDLWSIGCIMMEMLCGAAVFQGQVGAQFASPCPDATHRNFNSDQVHKVLSMAGTPASLAGFECASLIKGWPPFQRNVEPTVVSYCEAKADAKGNSSASWAQAVSGLLTTLPGERNSCSEVLAMPLFDHREYSEDAPGAPSLSGCCGFAHAWMESSSKPQNSALIRFASIESYVVSLQESCGKLQRDKVEEQNNIQKLSHEVDCLCSKVEAMNQDEKKLTAKLETLGDIHETLQTDFAAKFDVLCSQTEVARAELKESKQNKVRKESCIKALTDLNKEMKILVDAQQQEIENVLEISQQKNMEKEKCIKELAFELGTSRGNAKELTAELDALREKLQQDMIERENTSQKLSAEVISCKCDLQELHQNMVFCTSGDNCKNCAEMAQIERFRAAHMTKLVHRMHDLRKLLQRGLDYEPLEKLEDIFRLLADATSPLCGVHGVYSGTGPLPEDNVLKLNRVFSNNQDIVPIRRAPVQCKDVAVQVFDEFDELDFYSKVKSTPSVDDDDDSSDSERTSPTNPSARPNTLTALVYNHDMLQDMKALKCQVDSSSSCSCYSSRDNSPQREVGCVGSPTRVVRMSTSSSFWRVSDAREEHVKMLEDQLQTIISTIVGGNQSSVGRSQKMEEEVSRRRGENRNRGSVPEVPVQDVDATDKQTCRKLWEDNEEALCTNVKHDDAAKTTIDSAGDVVKARPRFHLDLAAFQMRSDSMCASSSVSSSVSSSASAEAEEAPCTNVNDEDSALTPMYSEDDVVKARPRFHLNLAAFQERSDSTCASSSVSSSASTEAEEALCTNVNIEDSALTKMDSEGDVVKARPRLRLNLAVPSASTQTPRRQATPRGMLGEQPPTPRDQLSLDSLVCSPRVVQPFPRPPRTPRLLCSYSSEALTLPLSTQSGSQTARDWLARPFTNNLTSADGDRPTRAGHERTIIAPASSICVPVLNIGNTDGFSLRPLNVLDRSTTSFASAEAEEALCTNVNIEDLAVTKMDSEGDVVKARPWLRLNFAVPPASPQTPRRQMTPRGMLGEKPPTPRDQLSLDSLVRSPRKVQVALIARPRLQTIPFPPRTPRTPYSSEASTHPFSTQIGSETARDWLALPIKNYF